VNRRDAGDRNGASFETGASRPPQVFPTNFRATGVGFPYAITVSIFGGTASAVALSFTYLGHETWFYWYLSGMILVSLIVYLTMRETKKDSAMHRHE